MALIIFSMVMLSTITALIFSVWWDSSASFAIHIALIAAVFAVLLSVILIISLYPGFRGRYRLDSENTTRSDQNWANDVSMRLSTPSAVIDGFNIIFANKAFLRELGMTGMRDLVTQMPLTNIVHPSSHAALTNFISQHDSHAESRQTLTVRLLYVDGTTVPAHISLSPLDVHGQSNLSLLQFTSTSQVQHETELEPEKFNFPLLLNNINQIIFLINVEQEIIYLNMAWESLTDYRTSETINKTLTNFIHPEDFLLVESRINALIQGKRQHVQTEARLIAKNGSSRWVEMRASRTSAHKGERSSIVGTLTDISHIKQIEAAQKQNRHSPLDMIITNVSCLVYRCKNDRNWTFEYVSDSCLEVTEYQSYELINSNTVTYMQLVYPEDRERIWEHVQEQIAKQRRFQMIYRILTRSNKTRWVMEQGEGIFSASGELLALEGIVFDLSNDNISEMATGLEQMRKLTE
ncbi:PAS domain-containing protein [Methylophaga lonarensis]|uniref:PAS domain-containing protein n=1 Tax=Methylophaga lonarensis TaxID=999151 RepID=UPI003D2A3CC0